MLRGSWDHETKTEMESAMKKWISIWWTAVRPYAFPASVMPAFFGAAAAYYCGYEISFLNLVLTILGASLIHCVGNLINDIFDYKKGIDKEIIPVSGAIVRGLLSPSAAAKGAAVFASIGCAIGVYFVLTIGVSILWLGIGGMLLAVFYTAPPFQLKYRAFGDLTIFLAFGTGVSLGSWCVQTGFLSWIPVLWAIPIAMLVVAILHANNWRDISRDGDLGAHSVAQLVGDKYSYYYYVLLTVGAMVLSLAMTIVSQFWPLTPALPWTVLIVVLALPAIMRLTKIARDKPMVGEPPSFVILDAQTAQLNSRFGMLLTVALILGRVLNL